MPYILQERRAALRTHANPSNAGELNYILTLVIKEYFVQHSNYQGINDIVGALSACASEFYRRIVIPYENEKIKTNGDVYL